ncbi:MAG TPA: HlyD family type I secretion periplasmic adaptor subunit [Stellaceae bacterium]|nr:HlyD family type I secretion periplasmic adaptor subunit [Stellaceae bacterium]
MKSDNAVVPAPGAVLAPRGRRRYELEFLPAALEIVETPPSPVGRATALTIVGLFCIALAWACLGHVDIVATAPGKIVPSGRSKVIQPVEIGVVRAIHVHDGQTVKAGDVLIELDPTINDADLRHEQADLIAAQLEVARLRALLSGDADPAARFVPPSDASPDLVATQRQYLVDQLAEEQAKLASLDRQAAQKSAERATAAASIDKIAAVLPLLQQQVDIRKTLFEHETGSRLVYLQTLQTLVEQQQDLMVEKSRLHEAEAALAAIIETRNQTAAEFRRARMDELTKAEQKMAGLAQDVIKAEQRGKFQQLTAPVDGVVQQLAAHTVGGVVTPAQQLLVVVPLDNQLEIEAMVSNDDVGFVRAGQEAEIKVATFNFTRYGLLHGRVLNVSEDAVTPERAQDRSSEDGRGGDSTAPKTQMAAFAARVSLDQTRMQLEDRLVNLSPGMAVSVEIKTGSRRIISYLLSPLARYRAESLRER